MKIWVVDCGAYGNNHIDSVFLSESKAKEHMNYMNKNGY